MDLRLSKEQEQLRRRAGELLECESPIRRSRETAGSPEGYSRELWRKLAGSGFLGIGVGKRFGGDGRGFMEVCLVLEELARRRVPSPYLTSIALCAQAIERWGTEDQKRGILPAMAAGDRIVAFADAEPGASWDSPPRVTASPVTDGKDGRYLLTGEKTFVPYAHVADLLLVTARRAEHHDGGEALLLVDPGSPGVSIEPLQTMDWDHYGRVRFDGVRVSDVLGADRQGLRRAAREPAIQTGDEVIPLINRWGAAARCAEMVGGAERVLEMSLQYAKKRTQFERPIGSFQAVQHRCADMAVDALSARLAAYEAIWRLSEGLDAAREVSIAKAWVGDAYQRICAAGHQIHGALGYTMGHSMHLFYRHSRAADLQFGDAGFHRELLARQLGM